MRLWNRNFTILTLGSFVSALGSAAAGIAFGILIYLETHSPLILAVFTISNILPRVITNFVAGPFIDRHSRRKIIFMIDFFYAVLFGVISLILFTGYFNVIVFTLVGALIGIVDTVYQIAFMSLFPEVISKGNHTKAYSVSSLIWPISAAIMAPITAYFIETFLYGVAILMVFNAVTFFVTASLETFIKVEEELNKKVVRGRQFLVDIKESIKYYKKEKGILGIGILFACFSFVYAVDGLLKMPYFINSDIYTLVDFSFLISFGAIGRIVGGIIHYYIKIPKEKKFAIALTVYFSVEIMGAFMLFTPYFVIVTFSFFIGLLSVTSFNIRMSATQTYIPNQIRGRVNSVQQLLWNIGAILGTLILGITAELTNIGYQWLILITASVSITAIFLVPVRMKEEFKKIYNVDV